MSRINVYSMERTGITKMSQSDRIEREYNVWETTYKKTVKWNWKFGPIESELLRVFLIHWFWSMVWKKHEEMLTTTSKLKLNTHRQCMFLNWKEFYWILSSKWIYQNLFKRKQLGLRMNGEFETKKNNQKHQYEQHYCVSFLF